MCVYRCGAHRTVRVRHPPDLRLVAEVNESVLLLDPPPVEVVVVGNQVLRPVRRRVVPLKPVNCLIVASCSEELDSVVGDVEVISVKGVVVGV